MLMTLCYTQHLRGQLERLPRLHTFQQRLNHEYANAVWLDLGDSCVPDVWPCAVTEGRSTLLALDAMGYHAANVHGVLSDASRQKLALQVSMGLVTDRQTWRYQVGTVRDEGIVFALMPTPALRLCVVLTAYHETRLTDTMLHLAEVQAGQVGIAQVNLDNMPALMNAHTLDIPADVRPSATLSATVELIQEEARYYEQKSG